MNGFDYTCDDTITTEYIQGVTQKIREDEVLKKLGKIM